MVFVARPDAAGSVAHHPYHWMTWYGRLQNYPQSSFWAEAGTTLDSARLPVVVGGKEQLQHRLADQLDFRHSTIAYYHLVVPVAAVVVAVAVAVAVIAGSDGFLLS